MIDPQNPAHLGVNPYESPLNAGPSAVAAAQSQSRYRSAHLLAMLAIGLLALMALVSVVGIVNDALQYQMVNARMDGIRYTREAAITNNWRIHATSQAVWVVGIATAVVFLMWTYRAYKNLPALGGKQLVSTPGMAIVWWFVPLVNFIIPCTVMLEIWRNSDPLDLGADLQRSSAKLVGYWWCAYLARVLAAWAVILQSPASGTHASLDLVLTQTVWSIGYFCISVIAAVFAILMVRRINAMQDARFEALQNSIPVAEAV